MQFSATLGATLEEGIVEALKGGSSAKTVHAALIAAGMTEPGATYGTYQAYHETGAFTSPLYQQHNNASGIMYAGQHGAKKGSAGYAWFNTLADWAAAAHHELTKKSNPAGATTIPSFVTRLKANGYFTDSVSNYQAGITRAATALKGILPDPTSGSDWTYGSTVVDDKGKAVSPAKRAIDTEIADIKAHIPIVDSPLKTLENLPTWGKVAAGAVGLLIIYKLVS